MSSGGRNFEENTGHRDMNDEETVSAQEADSSLSVESVTGQFERVMQLHGGYFAGLVKGPAAGGLVSNSSSASDIPGERRRPSFPGGGEAEEEEDEDDPSVWKLGLSRSRARCQRTRSGYGLLAQSDSSDDNLVGPPQMNFNEPLLFEDNVNTNGGDFTGNGGDGGIGGAGGFITENHPPTLVRPPSLRALNDDSLVSQLGLETPSLRNGSNNNGTICCRHPSNHSLAIASLDLGSNNFYCHSFGQCCAHGYRHKLGAGKSVRQRHFIPTPAAL